VGETIRLRVSGGGWIKAVHHDALAWQQLGGVSIQRGSHVEPTANGEWTADLSPVGGPVLGPFAKRGAALAAELRWLERHWLPTNCTPTEKGTEHGSDV
jgi:hypothetical protein